MRPKKVKIGLASSKIIKWQFFDLNHISDFKNTLVFYEWTILNKCSSKLENPFNPTAPSQLPTTTLSVAATRQEKESSFHVLLCAKKVRTTQMHMTMMVSKKGLLSSLSLSWFSQVLWIAMLCFGRWPGQVGAESWSWSVPSSVDLPGESTKRGLVVGF